MKGEKTQKSLYFSFSSLRQNLLPRKTPSIPSIPPNKRAIDRNQTDRTDALTEKKPSSPACEHRGAAEKNQTKSSLAKSKEKETFAVSPDPNRHHKKPLANLAEINIYNIDLEKRSIRSGSNFDCTSIAFARASLGPFCNWTVRFRCFLLPFHHSLQMV